MSDWLMAGLFAVVGFGVGLAYFALVRRTARQLASGEVRVGGTIGALGLRLLLFAPGAVAAGMLSVVVLAVYMVGFIGARFVAVRTWTAS